MKLANGTVEEGKVVIDGDPLPEGSVVTVIAPDSNETFTVPPDLESELKESLAQAARDEAIPIEEVIRRLRVY